MGGRVVDFPGRGDVHWPTGHPLSCGVPCDDEGDGITCPRCLANVVTNLHRFAKAMKDVKWPPDPREPIPRLSSLRIEDEGAKRDRTEGFRVASGAEMNDRRIAKKRRTWWIFRSDGQGCTEVVTTRSGKLWRTDDPGTARAVADLLDREFPQYPRFVP